jgi:hypothetical protein
MKISSQFSFGIGGAFIVSLKMKTEHDEDFVDPIEEAIILERQGQGYLCEYRSCPEEDDKGKVGIEYKRFHPINPDDATEYDYFLPHGLAGSEYAVSWVNYGNLMAFLRRYMHLKGIFGIRGDYERYGIAVGLDVQHLEIWRDLASLIENPVLDEAELLKVEQREQRKSWNEWAAYDYRKALELKYHCELGAIDKETLWKIFNTMAERRNESWVEGICGGWAYINVDRVLEGTPYAILAKNGAIRNGR